MGLITKLITKWEYPLLITMVNNHGFLIKNHQKTTKKFKKQIKTNDLGYGFCVEPFYGYSHAPPHPTPPGRGWPGIFSSYHVSFLYSIALKDVNP